MKILFIRSNPVNPDSRVEKEIATLAKAGHDVMLFAWDRTSDHPILHTEELFGEYKINVYRIGIESVYSAGFKKNLRPLLKFQVAIHNFIKKHKDNVDVIHACDFDTAFSSFFSKPRKCQFVYDVFDYYVDSFSVPGSLKSMVEKIDTHIMNKADAVIICTEERVNQLRFSTPKKLIVIHNTPMKLVSIEYESNNSHEKVKIAYIGILSYGRNILETCLFVSQNVQFELHIGGFGILEPEVKKFAEENENIIFYGKLSYAETLSIENRCDILIAFYDPSVPNHKFAAPSKFYEALMLGKPLIMAENTGMSEVVKKNDIGSVVPYSSPQKGFMELLERKVDWKKMGEREKKLYDELYSWNTMSERLVKLYQDLEHSSSR